MRHDASIMPHDIALRGDPRRWLTLVIVASALFMICVDMTVLYTALPTLARELGASNSQKLWIVNVYALVVAGLLPGLGTLGDRRGHRRLFLVGLAVFGVASVLAALSSTPAALIAARVLLGVGGATMMPATLALIRQAFTDDRERAMAIGWWAGIASGGLALGPVIGGWLLEHYAWGSVFLVNLPVVALAALATVLYVPVDVPRGGPPWDAIGSVLVMGGLFALVLAIKSVAETPLPVWRTLLSGGSALALLYAFQRWQQRSAVPLIDFSLLRLPGFAAGVAGAGLGTAGIVGLELLLGQHLQLVRGLSPLQTGLFLLPAPLGSFVAGPLAGALLHRHGTTPVGAGGLLLAAAAALALLALPTTEGISLGSMALLGLVGLGVGAAASAASSAIMSGAPPGRAGMAASLEEVSYELGSALGVAVFGSLMTLVYVTATGRALVDRTLDAAAFTRALQAVLVGVALLWVVTGLAMLRSDRTAVAARAS